MKTLKSQRIASTYIDLHGERRTPDQLRTFLAFMPNESFMWNDHNIGSKPVARGYNMKLVELDDGEFVVEIDLDILDEETFNSMGGYSISYTDSEFTQHPTRPPSVKVYVSPREFDLDDFMPLLESPEDGYVINIARWNKKGLVTAALIVLSFAGLSAAQWFLTKMYDGAWEHVKNRFKSAIKPTEEKTGTPTRFQLLIPVVLDNGEVQIVLEFMSEDFDRIGFYTLNAQAAVDAISKAYAGEDVVKVVARVAADADEWTIDHAITRDGQVK